MPNRPENIDTYRELIDETLATCDPEEIENLRTAIFSFVNSMSPEEKKSKHGKEFKRIQMAVHLLHQRNQYEKKGLDKLYAYASVALVRYIDLTNIDRPFYEAGMAAKKVVSRIASPPNLQRDGSQ